MPTEPPRQHTERELLDMILRHHAASNEWLAHIAEQLRYTRKAIGGIYAIAAVMLVVLLILLCFGIVIIA